MSVLPKYEHHLCFQCTQCGKCCTRPGVVVLTPGDIKRIAGALGFEEKTFLEKYKLGLFESGSASVLVTEKRACVFLSEQGQCTIHEIKPEQCRTYPFWPEILESERTWHDESVYCEGIGQGKQYSIKEIEALMLKDTQS